MYVCLFVIVRNGYSCVPVALSDGVDIKLGTAVTEISYAGPGVSVKATDVKTPNQTQVYKGTSGPGPIMTA